MRLAKLIKDEIKTNLNRIHGMDTDIHQIDKRLTFLEARAQVKTQQQLHQQLCNNNNNHNHNPVATTTSLSTKVMSLEQLLKVVVLDTLGKETCASIVSNLQTTTTTL